MSYGLAQSNRLDAVFAALADATRRSILTQLLSGDASVNDLVKPFNMSQPAISKHLKVLERAGLITRATDKQRRLSRAETAPLEEATRWLESYRETWERNYSRLDQVLEEMNFENRKQKKEKNNGQNTKNRTTGRS